MAYVALGVTGGIGAYKAVEVVRGLQRRGHDVVVVMTRAARRFVGPLTFEAISRRRVVFDQFAPGANADIEHISIASTIDLLLVAPATANIIAKFATGIADDFLSSLYLATRAPVLMAPAMNTNMLAHETVQQNVAALAARGVRFVDPGSGYLACGWIGKGRLAQPEEIVAAAASMLGRRGGLERRTFVVTAGPTYEDFDPVRFIGNRSSGRMGFALAEEGARRGARVVLVAGPTQLPPPAGVDLVRVRSAAEMREAVISSFGEADAMIMAAAVADYTVDGGARADKVAKGAQPLTLHLVPTVDILAELGRARGDRPSPVLVGFAAETGDLVERARAKLRAKRVDLIVANEVGRDDSGFDADTNAAVLVTADREEPQPLQRKSQLASVILDWIEAILADRSVSVTSEAPGS
jgi:phosphopantothenoylcysteine decarboxylase/phosphopantothenate--cysteine ligase